MQLAKDEHIPMIMALASEESRKVLKIEVSDRRYHQYGTLSQAVSAVAAIGIFGSALTKYAGHSSKLSVAIGALMTIPACYHLFKGHTRTTVSSRCSSSVNPYQLWRNPSTVFLMQAKLRGIEQAKQIDLNRDHPREADIAYHGYNHHSVESAAAIVSKDTTGVYGRELKQLLPYTEEKVKLPKLNIKNEFGDECQEYYHAKDPATFKLSTYNP